MPTASKAIVDAGVRREVIANLGLKENAQFIQSSNSSFKTIVKDENGDDRLVEVKIIVGRVDEAKTAKARLDEEVAKWEGAKAKAAERIKKNEEKAQKDRERRLAEKKIKEGEKKDA